MYEWVLVLNCKGQTVWMGLGCHSRTSLDFVVWLWGSVGDHSEESCGTWDAGGLLYGGWVGTVGILPNISPELFKSCRVLASSKMFGLDSHWHLCRRLESAEHGLASWSLGTHSCCVPSPFIACGFPLTKAFRPHESWTGRHSGPKRTVSSFTQERAQQLSCCHVEQSVISPSVSESTCHRKAFVCVYDFYTLMMLDLSHCCRSPGVRMDKTFRGSSSLPWCIELIHFHFYCFFPRSNCIPCL